MNPFARVLFFMAGLGAVVGMLAAVNVASAATSAPQQAGGYAEAIAWAVIPYCLARAAEKCFAPSAVTTRPEPVTSTATAALPKSAPKATQPAGGVYEIK